MADTPTPKDTEDAPAPTVTELAAVARPAKTRWSGQLPTALTDWLETTADARMCSEALLIAKGLELLQGSLPPLP